MSSNKIDIELAFRAIAYERKNNYCNTQGKIKNFSNFILDQLEILKETLIISLPLKNLLIILTRNFMEYDELCLADKKNAIEKFSDFIDKLAKNRLDELVDKKDNTYLKKTTNEKTNDWKDFPVKYIKGVGEKLSEDLSLAKIFSVKDLLRYYPRKHLNYANRTKIKDCKIGQLVTIWGVIKSVTCFTPPNNKNITILTIVVNDGTGRITASWFYGGANRYRQEQYKRRFPENAQVLLSGKVKIDKFSKKLALDAPESEVLGEVEIDESKSLHANRIVPVYPLVEGLNLKFLRRTIKTALDTYSKVIEDPLPDYIKKEYKLIDLSTALINIHFPNDEEILEKARYRLIFDELFYMQLGFAFKRKINELNIKSISLNNNGELIDKFLDILPFKLTKAQDRVFNEICVDLASPKPMSRLVQGDVGSGKTVVAFLSLLMAIQNGYQASLMAPTEILAEQHFRKFALWCHTLGLKCGFLSGSLGKKQKRETLAGLEDGNVHMAVGTHALIQEDVKFKNLGLVVVDEQHRFGVLQRAELKNKGNNPQVLTMTATPIPRTLALSLHGDLDVSVIDELPPGRKPIETKLIAGKRSIAWELIRNEINIGRQAYIVFPLIEESEKLTAKAATVEAQKLQDKIFPEFKIGLLHGQMKNEEKDLVMKSFINKETHILVATTVIEVGVDVPNASVMVIENAERFGLAQLHQLRGRVGRGAEKSYCLLISDKLSEISQQRLKIMTETNDGFVIAEQDLKIRGPGEFLGTRQSGLPDLLIADLVRDTETLELARNISKKVIENDNQLLKAENELMKKELYEFFRNNKDYFIS
ncbi:MAG: ATP-dependent DNA helicase RecG [Candidatus Sericytochromatia bacterium]